MSLSFLYPSFLIGLIFLSIPIIIHLLQKKKIVKLQFSTTLFFKSSDLKKSRFRKLNQILQLIIRILIVLLLVTLFSNPFNNNNPFNKLASKKIKIYGWIDQSLSMDLNNGKGSLIKLSNEIASIIDSSLQSSLFIYKENDFIPFDKNSTLETSTNYPKFLDFISTYNKLQVKNESAILIISDFQKSNKHLNDFIHEDNRNLILSIDMHPEEILNMSIDSLEIFQSPEKTAVVSLSKVGAIKTNTLELINNGMRRGHESISFSDKNSDTAIIKLSAEISNGTLKLNNKDNFSHDDKYYFSERELSKTKILLVQSSNDFSTFEEAIKTVVDSADYDITSKSIKNVKAEDIENSQLIILNDLVQASSPIYSLIKPGLFKNKHVVFSPSLKSEAKIFNQEILSYLNPKFKYEQIDTAKLSPSVKFSSRYLWKNFKQTDLNEIRINSFINNLPGSSLLKSTTNSNLVAKITDMKQTEWIISAIELEASENNNIATTGFYIPLVDRMIKELGFSENISSEGFVAGKTFTTPISDQRNEFEISGITNTSFKQLINTPYIKLSNPGIYKIKNSTGKFTIFPVNIDKTEKDLSYLSLKEINLPQNFKYLKPSQLKPFIKSLNRGNFEFPLITALFILLLLELLLTIFIKGKRPAINPTI